MARIKTLLNATIVTAVLAVSTAAPALAWDPKGVIVKKVQNVTTASALADANDEGSAVGVKPGDTSKYVIEVKNNGQSASNGHNDMAKTIITDTLPAGVELANSPATRKIEENLGLIKPGETKTKEYTLKVTSQTDGAITNKACFTGDSTANDKPQNGCDVAIIKVKVPEVPKTPETPKTPEQPTPQPETPAALPATGPEVLLSGAAGAGAVAYAGYNYARSRRILR